MVKNQLPLLTEKAYNESMTKKQELQKYHKIFSMLELMNEK